MPQDIPNAAPNQWFTGSLEAPSPALPKAGMLAIEPYAVFQFDTGAYADNGHHLSTSDNASTAETLLVIKYGITSRLTVEALPSLSRSWNSQSHSSGAGVGDLPIELEYRLTDGNYHNGAPSLTLDLGVTLPTGEYDRLSKSLNGVGQGAYLLKQGVVLQSLFDTPGNHPVRIRVYASLFEPLSHPGVNDLSVYGTSQGFAGRVRPGISGQWGIGGGWALDRHWVFAVDLVQNLARGYRLTGVDGGGSAVATTGPNTSSTALAPAIEYNWSANGGLIAGVEYTAAGRNTASYVAPQIAVAISF
ncbi:hypothetical protein [Novosphingobium sp.]|uniref:hypothetical protein n=1 Tax=Novosphingobium sp. TaxID=1874826 RepID=UPI003B52BA69